MAESADIPGTVETDDALLAALLARIVPAVRPVAVYLFGSRARGDHRADSDYDILVVVEDGAPKRHFDPAFLYGLKQGLPMSADIFGARRSNFERLRHEVGSLAHIVGYEGRRIYGR
ncbi:MAG TPA: nucleotidyltransferase domain-containing protein [Alphaproteobacteria bacterium]|nr:nucleotidyltransferase domain-containing protein [Alphaproteobacteria bacterium]